MKRCCNISLWAGFLIAIAGLFSTPALVQFPITRDFAWANLLIFLAGAFFLGQGIQRAFAQPDRYRGKLTGIILAAVTLIAFSFFVFGIFFATRVPVSAEAPRAGQEAPGFTLPDQTGTGISLQELLSAPLDEMAKVPTRALLLIFYRGHW